MITGRAEAALTGAPVPLPVPGAPEVPVDPEAPVDPEVPADPVPVGFVVGAPGWVDVVVVVLVGVDPVLGGATGAGEGAGTVPSVNDQLTFGFPDWVMVAV